MSQGSATSRSGRRPTVTGPAEREDHLRAAAVAVEQERHAAALGVEARLDLGGRGHTPELTPRFRQLESGRLGRNEGRTVRGRIRARRCVSRRRRCSPAQVPCTNIGGGHYECNWYRPGDGYSGGSLVVVGTTTVGYLPQGKNWIICQQAGGDVRNADGNRNNWYGWTEAENGKLGWASPLDAVGGDDYGTFGGGTPNCNGAHGAPPAWSGRLGRRPGPGAARHTDPGPGAEGRTSTRTATPADADCDDLDRHVHPGAPEVPNDGVDQDCNGADAAGRLSAVVGFSWTKHGSSIKVKTLQVTEAPPGATVTVTCSGKRKGCPKPKTFTTSAKGSVSMTKMFRKRLKRRRDDHGGGHRPQHGRPRQALHDPPQGRPPHPDALPRPGSPGAGPLLTPSAYPKGV